MVTHCSPSTFFFLPLTSIIIISCLVSTVSSKCMPPKPLLRSRELTLNPKSRSGLPSLLKKSRMMLKAWYSRPTPFRLGDDMGADSSSGKIDDGERRGGNEAIRGEQDNPIRIPSSSSSSSRCYYKAHEEEWNRARLSTQRKTITGHGGSSSISGMRMKERHRNGRGDWKEKEKID
mmetsp:Transcript_42605/g.68648  ORF Transcript_42605/g.68648 Transcript_42605/m.68648 type:complete len:176 (+) Transcript_42605:212-739(+)